jgi:hypothetical protein
MVIAALNVTPIRVFPCQIQLQDIVVQPDIEMLSDVVVTGYLYGERIGLFDIEFEPFSRFNQEKSGKIVTFVNHPSRTGDGPSAAGRNQQPCNHDERKERQTQFFHNSLPDDIPLYFIFPVNKRVK